MEHIIQPFAPKVLQIFMNNSKCPENHYRFGHAFIIKVLDFVQILFVLFQLDILVLCFATLFLKILLEILNKLKSKPQQRLENLFRNETNTSLINMST